jgi:hypothetical protein
MLTTADLWTFLPLGYLLSILIETPVLLIGLSGRHSMGRRLFAGFWLTACTYPIVILVMPLLITSRGPYLLVAETFAPVAECALFWMAFGTWADLGKRPWMRDMAAVVLANLASFGGGELLRVTVGQWT